MITVVIPTLDAAPGLAATLEPLMAAAVDGFVRQVVVSDGGSTDQTLEIASETGCDVVHAKNGRGSQLAAGAEAARHPWLLFLHADTVLDAGWDREAQSFIERTGRSGGNRAAAFRFALDDYGFQPQLAEKLVALRCAIFALPYGDQGLLISHEHYQALGGFGAMELMEDVDMARRIGRRELTVLPVRAITSAERYRRDGYLRRSLRNFACLTLFFLRVPPSRIARIYG